MARKRLKTEADLVPDMCAPVSYTAPVHHPASYAWRGNLIRTDLQHVAQIIGREVDAEIITYFCPDAERRTGKNIEWLAAKMAAICTGKGCAQSTFAALMPVLWRLPRLGWPVWMSKAPFAGYSSLVRVNGGLVIQRHDGHCVPFPPRSKEAA